jgi:glycosyltransferase involved in cell wall biosynthesis
MTANNQTNKPERPRVLITAFHYDRAHSMESRLSWQRAQHAAEDYDVTVVCARSDAASRAGGADDDRTSVVELPVSRFERALMSRTETFYVGYRLWHRRVYGLARRLHAERPFALVHQVSFCGYREPSDCWRLGAPFVLGPVGGTRPFPLRFVGELDARGALREVMRNVVNACQLRFAFRVRRAMRSAATVLAANREVASDLERCYGVAPRVQLETGISQVRTTPRPQRDASLPLKILWSGRLRSWKGLPLLLRALAALPPDCRYTLRILGQGVSQERWERLAERLGIDGNIEWAGWSNYRDQLPHYDWADLFAFTSLRDTSGTGLLEALAAGAPIIGIDHQGAADIMTDACAVRVPATSSAKVISAFSAAVLRLSENAAELAQLSDGALQRARQFHWDQQWADMRDAYRSALSGAAASETVPARREQEPALAPAGAAQNAFC